MTVYCNLGWLIGLFYGRQNRQIVLIVPLEAVGQHVLCFTVWLALADNDIMPVYYLLSVGKFSVVNEESGGVRCV